MADNMEEELKKMKVPELKQALKEKGLSTSGTKPDLIKRLVGSSIDSTDPVLDEDEILLKDDPSPAANAVPVKLKPAPALPVEKSENVNNSGSKAAEPVANVQMPADTTDVAKPTEVQKLTDAERLKLRAEKFGATSEQSKKDIRAQRFGIALTENKSGNISSSNEPVDVEKLKQRAERFGVSTSSVTEDEKKRKRAERFGTNTSTSTPVTSTPVTSSVSLNSTDSELEAKKRKRAERFGLT